MSKIAVLLPKEYMLEQARKVIQEKNADIDILKVIKTSDSVYEARKAMEQGAGIRNHCCPGSAGSIYQRIYQYTGGRNHTDRSGNSAYGCGGKKAYT